MSILVVVGSSGSGKSTLVNRLVAELPELVEAVSVTTRAIREGEGESQGVPYYFVDDEAFDRLDEAGAFVEVTTYPDGMPVPPAKRYGVTRDEIARCTRLGDVLIIAHAGGARQIKQAEPDALIIYLSSPGQTELARRMLARGTDPGTVALRTSPEVLANEATFVPCADYVINPGGRDAVFHAASAIIQSIRTGTTHH